MLLTPVGEAHSVGVAKNTLGVNHGAVPLVGYSKWAAMLGTALSRDTGRWSRNPHGIKCIEICTDGDHIHGDGNPRKSLVRKDWSRSSGLEPVVL